MGWPGEESGEDAAMGYHLFPYTVPEINVEQIKVQGSQEELKTKEIAQSSLVKEPLDLDAEDLEGEMFCFDGREPFDSMEGRVWIFSTSSLSQRYKTLAHTHTCPIDSCADAGWVI